MNWRVHYREDSGAGSLHEEGGRGATAGEGKKSKKKKKDFDDN